MAQSLAAWLRDAVAPALAGKGAALTGLENYDSYECRTRNRIPGAKLSEHAHGDAIDVRAFSLAGGRRLALTDPQVDQALRTAWRDAACHSFTTVLGPGDRYHSGHIHLDDIVRHNGYRICEWQVRVPPPPPKPGESGPVPLPRPRPAALGR
ncbi:MAG: extensin family protein [Pseudolabrys sp.]